MLSYLESVTVVLLCVAMVVLLMQYLNKRLEDKERKLANGVNGWQLSILGSIYAVVLGFMLSDAWLAYQKATDDIRKEAAAVLMIHRLSNLMPSECATPLQHAAQAYVKAVLDEEWPAMEQNRIGEQASTRVRNMWNIVGRCDVRDAESGRQSIIIALEALKTRRDARIEDVSGQLPLIMWSVLIFGGIIVITSSCILGNEKKSVHCFHIVSLTVLISVTLLAIADLDRPFDGATRIRSTVFQRVQAEMSERIDQ